MPNHFFAALHFQHTLACIFFIYFFVWISLSLDLALDSTLALDDGFEDEIQVSVASNVKAYIKEWLAIWIYLKEIRNMSGEQLKKSIISFSSLCFCFLWQFQIK